MIGPVTDRLESVRMGYLRNTGHFPVFLVIPARDARSLLKEWEPLYGMIPADPRPPIDERSDLDIYEDFLTGCVRWRHLCIFLGAGYGAGQLLDKQGDVA